jgi:glycosyltransferase involved in cell wall biosynthesis
MLRKSWPIDIVEFCNWEGIGAVTTLLSSLPVVIRVHTTAYESLSLRIGNQRLERGYARLERLTAHCADGLVTNSTAHQVQASFDYGVRPEQITVASLGLESQVIDKAIARTPRQILAVGPASSRKGIDFFLEVASQLVQEGVEGQFVWVGQDTRSAPGGLFWSEYVGQAYPHLKAVVHFKSDVNDEQLAQFYAQSGVYFCSARYESFGLTLVEAMQAGTPVVAPDTGSVAEILGNNVAGLKYASQNVESAVIQLKLLLAEPELARRLGEQGRQRARTEYSAEAMTDRVMAFYEKVLQQTMK